MILSDSVFVVDNALCFARNNQMFATFALNYVSNFMQRNSVYLEKPKQNRDKSFHN